MWDLEKMKNTTAFDISNDLKMFLILMALNDHEWYLQKKEKVHEKGYMHLHTFHMIKTGTLVYLDIELAIRRYINK